MVYGIVGDSSSADPWLDKAFATLAEEWSNPSSADELGRRLIAQATSAGLDGRFGPRRDAARLATVYGKGGAALMAAAEAAGAEALSMAIGCYVDATPSTIAAPDRRRRRPSRNSPGRSRARGGRRPGRRRPGAEQLLLGQAEQVAACG